MIDVVMPSNKTHMPIQNYYGRTGDKANWGHNRVTRGMKQPENWYANPLGRHPFNVLTKETINE